MRFLGSKIAIGAALALAQPAWAQEASTVTEPAPQAEVAPAPEAGSGPADGQAAEAEQPGNAAAPEFTSQTFGDWEVRCTVEPRNCFMYFLAKDANENPVSEIRIVALPADQEGEAGVTVVTPIGTLLSNGLVVRIDAQRPIGFPYTWCSQSGCFSRFALDTGTLNAFKRGNVATMFVSSINAPDKPIPLEVSLSGFTAAFNALTE